MIQKTPGGWGEIVRSFPQIAQVLFAFGLYYSRDVPTMSLAQPTQGTLVHYSPVPT